MSQEKVSPFSFHKHIRSYLSENISLADAKARICIYASLIMFILFMFLDIFVFGPNNTSYSEVQSVFWGLSLLFIFIAFICGIMVIYPQTAPAKKGFIYWGASLNFTLDEYKDELRLLSSDEILNELAVVNYNLGCINNRKFQWVKRSLQACIVAFLLIAADLVIFS